MARSTEAKCRQCRRENMKLFLKGERCYSEKCSMERRPYPPGQAGQGRRKFSEYGMQLREKQKVRRIYGVLEKQFRRYYKEASRRKGVTGELLLQLLEQRLDNVVYRMGFAASRTEGRLLVSHGHIQVNGRTTNIPSFLVKDNTKISVKEKSRKIGRVMEAMENVDKRGIPAWLEMDDDKFSGTVKGVLNREDLTIPIQEQLIVELYSK